MKGDPTTRFWAKVKRTRSCWLWLGALNSQGYGNFRIRKGSDGTVLAHVFAYQLLVGPIPEGKESDHVCRIRRCIRPSKRHVEMVSHRTNMLRGLGASGMNARRTHCKHGHRYTKISSYYRPKKGRVCRLCTKAHNERRKGSRHEQERSRSH